MQPQLGGQKNKMNLNFSLKDSKQKEVHLGKRILLVEIKMNKDKWGKTWRMLQSMADTLDMSFRHGTSTTTVYASNRCTGTEAANGDLHASEQDRGMNDWKEVLPSLLCLFHISSIYQVHRVLLQNLVLLAQEGITWKCKTSFWVLTSKAGLVMAEFCLELVTACRWLEGINNTFMHYLS